MSFQNQQQKQHEKEMMYRDACFLNNAGVSCLERGFYAEAIHWFTEAVTLMKRSMAPFDETSSATAHISVDKDLADAASFLGQVQQAQSLHHIRPMDDHDALSEAMFDHGLSSPYHFPIRIRCRNLATDSTSLAAQQLEVSSATVLYNLGLSNLSLFSFNVDKNLVDPKEGKKTLGCAFGALMLAHKILFQQADLNRYPELRLMQLSVLVLQCLFRLFRLTSQTKQAEQVLLTLNQLVKEAREYEVILKRLNVETSHHTFAPAA